MTPQERKKLYDFANWLNQLDNDADRVFAKKLKVHMDKTRRFNKMTPQERKKLYDFVNWLNRLDNDADRVFAKKFIAVNVEVD